MCVCDDKLYHKEHVCDSSNLCLGYLRCFDTFWKKSVLGIFYLDMFREYANVSILYSFDIHFIDFVSDGV
jgi:hypothetical protein